MNDSNLLFLLAGLMLVSIVLSVGTNISRVRRTLAAGQPFSTRTKVAFVIEGVLVVAFVAVLGVAIIGG